MIPFVVARHYTLRVSPTWGSSGCASRLKGLEDIAHQATISSMRTQHSRPIVVHRFFKKPVSIGTGNWHGKIGQAHLTYRLQNICPKTSNPKTVKPEIKSPTPGLEALNPHRGNSRLVPTRPCLLFCCTRTVSGVIT